jgi:hypothetical protein
VINFNVEHACLELCRDDSKVQGQPIATLDAALAYLTEQPTGKKAVIERYEVHADVASRSLETVAEVPAAAVDALEQEQEQEPKPEQQLQQRVEEGMHHLAADRAQDAEAAAACSPVDAKIAVAVCRIRGAEGMEVQRQALQEVLDAEREGTDSWADPWIRHGLLEVHTALISISIMRDTGLFVIGWEDLQQYNGSCVPCRL